MKRWVEVDAGMTSISCKGIEGQSLERNHYCPEWVDVPQRPVCDVLLRSPLRALVKTLEHNKHIVVLCHADRVSEHVT